MSKISIIIPTLNRPESLKACLGHIDACAGRENIELEAVIVDSSDNDASKAVSQDFSFARYIKTNVRNRSIQRDQGIQKSTGNIIAFLDDDCLVRDKWLINILKGCEQSDIDVIGGTVIDRDQERSEYYGTEIIGKVFPGGLTIANFNSPIGKNIEVDWLPGGNMAFRREVFSKISGFDKACIGTAGYEETDLCTRAKKSGCRLFFDPSIVVDHVRAKRADTDRDRRKARGRYYASRNYTYFLLKNYGLDIGKILFIYIKETYWQISYFIRKPALYNFYGIFANIFGKISGTLLAIRYHLFIKNKEKPLLQG